MGVVGGELVSAVSGELVGVLGVVDGHHSLHSTCRGVYST